MVMVDSSWKVYSSMSVSMVHVQTGVGHGSSIFFLWAIHWEAIHQKAHKTWFGWFHLGQVKRLHMVMVDTRLLGMAVKLVKTRYFSRQFLVVGTSVLVEKRNPIQGDTYTTQGGSWLCGGSFWVDRNLINRRLFHDWIRIFCKVVTTKSLPSIGYVKAISRWIVGAFMVRNSLSFYGNKGAITGNTCCSIDFIVNRRHCGIWCWSSSCWSSSCWSSSWSFVLRTSHNEN